MAFLKPFGHFLYHQALACLFPILIFVTLAGSTMISIPHVYRYDFILIVCLLIQLFFYLSGLETKEELKMITWFHLLGIGLEWFKVHMGSWSYPEEAWCKVWGVPLYSGFMYASVGSYIIQSWRRLQIQLIHWPHLVWTVCSGCVIYLNFFTHHFWIDLRWWIIMFLIVVFFRTKVKYSLHGQTYQMPLVPSFLVIGVLIWLGENIATFYGAWQYPNQQDSWDWVSFYKISSWSLLVIVSFIIIAQSYQFQQSRKLVNEPVQ